MLNIKYMSTRGKDTELTASQAILKGIANDGGLYVPTSIPKIDFDLEQMSEMTYPELAYEILKLYLDDFTEQEIKNCVQQAYDSKFDTEQIAPLVKVEEDYFLELFHGKTLAFKDMALALLPYLMTTSAMKNNVAEKIVILAATSGDTGKAALEGFANVSGTKIIVFYPEDGVSKVQEMQMITQEGENTCVVGLKGNFDDAQTAVKNIFSDEELNDRLLRKGYVLSSANSINIGRLVPQIVYYFYAYAQMRKNNYIAIDEKINFTVPTGNFGNILAGWYAKQMGLPIDKLICASNDNKVLFDFLNTGVYDKNRKFILTASPSMDILISSNLERLLYHLCQDGEKITTVMQELSQNGIYNFAIDAKDIIGEYALGDECTQVIQEVYKKDYIMDTHTAVAYASLKKYKEKTKDETKNIIVSTASPYKFPEAVTAAIDESHQGKESFSLLDTLAQLKKEDIPSQLKNLKEKQRVHWAICEKYLAAPFVEMYLGQ